MEAAIATIATAIAGVAEWGLRLFGDKLGEVQSSPVSPANAWSLKPSLWRAHVGNVSVGYTWS